MEFHFNGTIEEFKQIFGQLMPGESESLLSKPMEPAIGFALTDTVH